MKLLLLPQPRLLPSRIPRPYFRTFTRQPASRLNESKTQSPSEVEDAKQQQLKDGQWKPELASSSEEGVKADRDEVGDREKHMQELQRRTAQRHEEEHPEGKK